MSFDLDGKTGRSGLMAAPSDVVEYRTGSSLFSFNNLNNVHLPKLAHESRNA